MNADQLRSLQPALAGLLEEFRGCFKRESSFAHWERYLLGLMADLKRKSIEPIALAAGVAVRTLQEFLAFFVWDHERIGRQLQRRVMDQHAGNAGAGNAAGENAGAGNAAGGNRRGGIGVLDGSAHAKQGDKTPGVQRQWCGETGKIDNCIVAQHLLYTDNHPHNPFTCMLASDLYLPKSWAADRPRCQAAGIPDTLDYRPKWRIALEQVRAALGNGVRFDWLTFDEEYGSVPEFWFGLDFLGQRAVGEARPNFLCWPRWPACRSSQRAHAAKRIDNVAQHSPAFRNQDWQRVQIKNTTRGPAVWEFKAARVHLLDASESDSRPSEQSTAHSQPSERSRRVSQPTERLYWLIVARQPRSGEVKYFVSNAALSVEPAELLKAGFARWHVEKWFERAKQEAGLGAFEVRTYTSLMRHWLCARIVMYFLAAQTQRLRGEKSAHHARTSGRSRQRPGVEDLSPLLAFMG